MKDKGPPKPKKQHRFDLLQSVTVIVKPNPMAGNVPHTRIAVFRDENVLQSGYVIDNQDLYDAAENIDCMYRREIALALIDLPRVRRVEVTDMEGTGIVMEN